jgi:hypothetical protein
VALRRAGKGNRAAITKVKADANQRAHDLARFIQDLRKSGAFTLAAIANELNSREMVAPRGGRWHLSYLQRVIGPALNVRF